MRNQEITTFVCLDLEATGLQMSRPRITELGMVAVHRKALMHPTESVAMPRVLNKLTLCFCPRIQISAGSSQITGLYNDELEYHKDFDDEAFDLISLFLSRLEPPVCLIAHNGNNFDYPLLAVELARIGRSFPVDLLCCDSLPAFRDLDGLPMYPYGPPKFSPSPIRASSPSEGGPDSGNEDNSSPNPVNSLADGKEVQDSESVVEKACVTDREVHVAPPRTPEIISKHHTNNNNPLTSTPKDHCGDTLLEADSSSLFHADEDDSGIVSGDQTGLPIADTDSSDNLPENHPQSMGFPVIQESVGFSENSQGECAVANSGSPGSQGLESDIIITETSCSTASVLPEGQGSSLMHFPPVGPVVCSFQSADDTSEMSDLSRSEWKLKNLTPEANYQSNILDTPILGEQLWAPDVQSSAVRGVKRKLFPGDQEIVSHPKVMLDGSPSIKRGSVDEDLGTSKLIETEIMVENHSVGKMKDQGISEKGEQASVKTVVGDSNGTVTVSANKPAQKEEISWEQYEDEDSISDEQMSMLMCHSTTVSPLSSCPSSTEKSVKTPQWKKTDDNSKQILHQSVNTCKPSHVQSHNLTLDKKCVLSSDIFEQSPCKNLTSSVNATDSGHASVISNPHQVACTKPPHTHIPMATGSPALNETPSRLRVSYKLMDVHERVCGVLPGVSHRAEDDCLALLRICYKMAPRILPWMDKHAALITEVPVMYKTKKGSPLPRGVFPYQH